MDNDERQQQFLENRERRSRIITTLGIEAGSAGDERKNIHDEKIKQIIDILKDSTFRLDRRRVDGSLDMLFRDQMAHLIDEVYFGHFVGKAGRPSNEDRGVGLKNELEIGALNRQLIAEGVDVKEHRYEKIMGAGLAKSRNHIKKCINAYEEGMATDFDKVLDDAFVDSTNEIYGADYRVVKE